MATKLDDILHLSRKYNNECSKWTSPLEQFEITLFAIQQVTFDGYWSVMSSHLEGMEHSVDNQFYKYDPTLIDPRYYTSGIQYLNTHHNKDFHNTFIKDLAEKFDKGHPLVMIDKTPLGCEFYFFATFANNHKIINTYMANLGYLRKFIHYFKNEANKILREGEDYQVSLQSIKQNSFYLLDNKLEISSFDQNQFTAKNLSNDLYACLSNREQECLSLFLNGKTTKETAILLGLSYRTVEEYITNIKRKFRCQHKRELLAIFS